MTFGKFSLVPRTPTSTRKHFIWTKIPKLNFKRLTQHLDRFIKRKFKIYINVKTLYVLKHSVLAAFYVYNRRLLTFQYTIWVFLN